MRMKRPAPGIGLCAFLVFAAAAVVAGRHPAVRPYLSEPFIQEWAGRLGVWGPMAIVGLSLVLPFLFLPRWPLVFAAGALYGMVYGTLLGTAAGTLGALLHFTFSRRLLRPAGDRVRRRFGLPERMGDRQAMLLLFSVRAFPFSNYGLTNLLAAAINMRLAPFAVATALGMMPSTALIAAWGKLMRKPAPAFFALAIGLTIAMGAAAWWLGRHGLAMLEERRGSDGENLVGG